MSTTSTPTPLNYQPGKAVRDEDFVAYFELDRPEFSAAKSAATAKQFDKAAAEILRAIDATPLRGYTDAASLRAVAAELKRDLPQAFVKARKVSEIALGPKTTFDPFANGANFLEHTEYRQDAGDFTRRGRGWLHLGLLYALEGESRWRDAAAELISKHAGFVVPPGFKLPADPNAHIPIVGWHPGAAPEWNCNDIAHSMQNMAVTLPVLWTGFTADEKKSSIAYLAHCAEIFYRGFKDDPPYNIPLHGLNAMLGSAVLFPGLKGAPAWFALMAKNFGPKGIYVSEPCATTDGYYGEGLGYQNVNAMLVMRTYLLFRGSGREIPRELAAMAHAVLRFGRNNMLPDGSSFMVGDQMGRNCHEHEIEYHELAHFGSAFFEDVGLEGCGGSLRSAEPEGTIFLFMSSDDYARWKKAKGKRAAAALEAMPESGFLHLRSGEEPKTRAHGLLNLCLSHNHGHHDALSVTLYAGGRELLSNPGLLGYSLQQRVLQEWPGQHSMLRLGNMHPDGPRHDDRNAATIKRTYESASGALKVAFGEHRLVKGYRQRRALIGIFPNPTRKHDGVWVVWDYLAHVGSLDGREPDFTPNAAAPMRISETTFALHAPGGGAKTQGLSGWSCHSPQNRLRKMGEKEPYAVTSAEAHHAYERADSDANLQVTALPISTAEHYLGVEVQEGFTAHFAFGCVRPVLNFKWWGRMPHAAAYVLAPFKGLADAPPWDVSGAVTPEEFHATIKPSASAGKGSFLEAGFAPVTIRGVGLAGSTGTPAQLILSDASGKQIDTLTLPL